MASDLRKLLLSWTGTIKLVALIKSLYLSPSLAKFSSKRHLCNLSVKGALYYFRQGRSVSIHPDEPLFWELQQRQLTPAGRAKLRERVAVELFYHPQKKSRNLGMARGMASC